MALEWIWEARNSRDQAVYPFSCKGKSLQPPYTPLHSVQYEHVSSIMTSTIFLAISVTHQDIIGVISNCDLWDFTRRRFKDWQRNDDSLLLRFLNHNLSTFYKFFIHQLFTKETTRDMKSIYVTLITNLNVLLGLRALNFVWNSTGDDQNWSSQLILLVPGINGFLVSRGGKRIYLL